ncbi:putative methionine aminopeptidase type I [Babesia bovis T2Bo]|uniref:Methionine aminopeptidase n=1 Tax=Babesia bovis TaxID=5865 RepID=A7APE1_BABBO|nr:putative methionine aminopeptidase type I [Babesia bovis T2Bo]EDO08425.1 putative methionine aminopeptidase type I [Babesia bovis T2Bo]|eukprot:XP_001611993.1 methionine aminopeptidase [Babesia bovis T2Bo]
MVFYKSLYRCSVLSPKLILEKTPLGKYLSRSKKLGERQLLRYGEFQVLPSHHIPSHIALPPYASIRDPSELRAYYNKACTFAEVKSQSQIALMRAAAKIAAGCLKHCINITKEGVTAEDIDREGHEYIVSQGSYPAGVGFHGFPKAICISINEVACHGIPNTRPFQRGDIVSYDCTVFHGGVYGDCAGTIIVGDDSATDASGSLLVRIAKECVDKAIASVAPGVEFSKLAEIVTEHASKNSLGVIKEFGGHFIGDMMHMPPMVQFCHPSTTRGQMESGQIFTIEPIICEGNPEIYTWRDGWTIATCDGGRCAQFEHTVLVTDTGCEILTQ